MQTILKHLAQGGELTAEHLGIATGIILDGGCTPAQTGAFLMAVATRAIRADYLVAAAAAIRARAITTRPFPDAIDCCGTGGDHSHSLNISTATGFVAAGCGLSIAKHGNRAATSSSGAADVLEALGINLQISVAHEEHALATFGFSFLMAPNHHPSLKFLAPIRKELGFRTLFNVLGPLANPAGTKRQLIGVYDRALCRPVAEALRDLGSSVALVVHGSDGLDEVTLCGSTFFAHLQNGEIHEGSWLPSDFGLEEIDPAALRGGDAAFNAAALMNLLKGELSPYRDIVLANTAATLFLVGKVSSLAEGVSAARHSIDNGHALHVFTLYRDYTTTVS